VNRITERQRKPHNSSARIVKQQLTHNLISIPLPLAQHCLFGFIGKMQPVARRRHGSFKKMAKTAAAVATVTIASFGQGKKTFKLKTLRGPSYRVETVPQPEVRQVFERSHLLDRIYGNVHTCGPDTFRSRDANTNHVISADVVVAQNSDVNQTSASSSLRTRPRENLTDSHTIPKRFKRIEARAAQEIAVDNIRGWVNRSLDELDIRITVVSVDAENVYHNSKDTDTLIFINLKSCETVSCCVEDLDLLHVRREDVLRCMRKNKTVLKCFGGDYYRRERPQAVYPPKNTILADHKCGLAKVLRLKDPREGSIVNNLLRIFKVDKSGAPDSLDNVSPERKIPCTLKVPYLGFRVRRRFMLYAPSHRYFASL
jgi:hypothetical protein